MEKTYDVTALGEMLIDFTENGVSDQGNGLFEANPGGAPCNVLAMLQKLGRKTAFIGKVGDDAFGRLLRRTGEEAGIHMGGLAADKQVHTTLAFVQTAPDGDRDFSFYRDPGADMMLTAGEVPEELVTGARVFHFGTLSLTGEPVRAATVKAVALARRAGAVVSFDPNLRPPLWRDMYVARAMIAWGLAQAHVVKIADNELEFMTGQTDIDKGAAMLLEEYGNIRLLNVTAGAEGSYAYRGGTRVFQPAFRLGGTVETTGAGDTFCACVLDYVLEHGLEDLGPAELTEMLRFANAAAYLVTTKKGAIRSMPERAAVEELLAAHG